MRMKIEFHKAIRVMLILSWIFLLGTEAFAELKIDSVYPTLGLLGQDLEVTVTGTGFDENTRVSMSLDVGHKEAIIGSVDTPGSAYSVAVVGDKAYVADGGRGLQVIDISDQQSPQIIGSLDTPGSANSVTVVGDKAYVADGGRGLQVIDITDPQSPQVIGSVDTPETARDVTVVGDKAYVADTYDGLQVIDISNPQSPQVIGSVDTPGFAWSVTLLGDMAYVADSFGGLQVIDISNPQSPRVIGSVDTPGFARGVSIVGDKAYVTGENGGLWVIDVSNPQSLQVIGSVDTPGSGRGITTVGDKAYVADGGSLQVIDITNPQSPQIIGSVDTPGFAYGVTVVEDKAYVADGGGLQVIDVSDPQSPQVIGSVDTPGSAQSVAIIGSNAYVADMTRGLQVIDISNPQSPQVIGSVDTPDWAVSVMVVGDKAYVAGVNPTYTGMVSALHVIDISSPQSPQIIGSLNTPGEAWGVSVDGDKAYVADGGGLQVIDISDPQSPQIIGSVGTSDFVRSVTVLGDKAYVTSGNPWFVNMGTSFYVIDISDPQTPQVIGSVDTPDETLGVTVVGDNVYVANTGSGLQVIDVSDPRSPQIIGSVDTPGNASGVTVAGDKAYVADTRSGLQVVDVSDLRSPQIIGSVDTPGSAYEVTVVGDKAYIADGGGGLIIVPIPIEILPVTVNSESSISITLPSPEIAGHYNLRVFSDNESSELIGAVTFFDSDTYEAQKQKKAIIVAGGGPYPGNSLWNATQLSSNYAYLSLLSQGYTRENIYYLSPKTDIDVDGDGLYNDVDMETTNGKLSHAIKIWAEDANELLLYLTDHGGDGTFILNGTKNPIETITAETLDGWLDELQMTMPGKVIFIYDACRSGSFLPLLTPPEGKERIVITSSQADERAWFINGGILSFSYQFWASVFLNANLYDSYVVGKNMMAGDQTPLIDTNGNGIGSEKEDKILASNIIIGRGRVAASVPPIIGNVSGEQTIYGDTSATLWVSEIFSLNKISRVWAIIIPPDYNQGSSDIPITDLPAIDLVDPDQDGKYEGNYQEFTQKGTYSITVFAMDDQGMYSLPKQTTVIQTVGETIGAVISGTVLTDLAGRQDLGVVNATVTLQGTSYTTTTDSNGNFVLENIPTGSYILVISAPDLVPITQEIDLTKGQSLSVTLPKMTLHPKGDVSGDGKIGLEEAIHALQVISGVTPLK